MPKRSPVSPPETAIDLNAFLLALLIEAAEREERAPAEQQDLCDDEAMTLEEFRATLSAPTPPSASKALQALWYDARGDWDKAHEFANAIDDATGAWVHAYLHRKEGDLGNAAYWYKRAGHPVAADALDAEWERIAAALLSGSSSI